MRERLIELIKQKSCVYVPCDNECGGCKNTEMYDDSIDSLADHLLANGVIVLPFVAMVEQFTKDGEFYKKHTAHNGKYAVVYIDKSKWNCPLIDITEQAYNSEKAEERMQALKEAQ